MFFADTQNKLLYAVTHKTAAQIVLERANAALPNFGATSWEGTIVRKGDIFIAKNYLTADEIDTLNRLVTIFLETAELLVKRRQDLTMGYWKGNVESILTLNGFDVLNDTGHIRREDMKQIVAARYEEFDARRKAEAAAAADEEDMAELTDIEAQIVRQHNRAKETDNRLDKTNNKGE